MDWHHRSVLRFSGIKQSPRTGTKTFLHTFRARQRCKQKSHVEEGTTSLHYEDNPLPRWPEAHQRGRSAVAPPGWPPERPAAPQSLTSSTAVVRCEEGGNNSQPAEGTTLEAREIDDKSVKPHTQQLLNAKRSRRVVDLSRTCCGLYFRPVILGLSTLVLALLLLPANNVTMGEPPSLMKNTGICSSFSGFCRTDRAPEK